MATVDPKPQEPQTAQRKHRNRWKWVSIGLGVACAGLLVWALILNGNLDDTEQDLEQARAQAEQQQDVGGRVVAAAKGAYDALAAELGATAEDLEATQQDLEAATQDAEQAQQAADSAKQKAESTSDELDKAQAEAEQAKAEAEAAGSKAAIAADCAKAYVGAFGQLLDGGQADEVRTQLQGITDDCRAAFAGA